MGSAETRVTQVAAVEDGWHPSVSGGGLRMRDGLSHFRGKVLAAMLSWPHTLLSAEPTNVAKRAATRGHRAHGTARPHHLGLVSHAVPQQGGALQFQRPRSCPADPLLPTGTGPSGRGEKRGGISTDRRGRLQCECHTLTPACYRPGRKVLPVLKREPESEWTGVDGHGPFKAWPARSVGPSVLCLPDLPV